MDSLLVSQPDTGEQALEITEALVRSNAIDVIVVDSVAALVPRAEIEGEMGDSHVGLQARLMSQALRKLAGAISKSNCVAIFINQLREKVGVVYGNPEVTPGGRALKFYSSVRLDVRKKEVLKSGTDIIGSRTKVKVVKNKVAPPFREVEFDIMYGRASRRSATCLTLPKGSRSCRRAARGSRITARVSVRAATTRRTSCATTRIFLRKFPSSSVRTRISSTQSPSRAAVRRSPLKRPRRKNPRAGREHP